MKPKLIILGGLILTLVSCSKNYTCSCTSTYSDGSTSTVNETISFKAKNNSEANGNCFNLNETYNGINTTYDRVCVAKLN
jgi:hypothetical protein